MTSRDTDLSAGQLFQLRRELAQRDRIKTREQSTTDHGTHYVPEIEHQPEYTARHLLSRTVLVGTIVDTLGIGIRELCEYARHDLELKGALPIVGDADGLAIEVRVYRYHDRELDLPTDPPTERSER